MHAGYLTDQVHRDAPNLAPPFGDDVGSGVDLVSLLIQQQMVVWKWGPGICQWMFLVVTYSANMSSSSVVSAVEMSLTVSVDTPFGVCRKAALCWPLRPSNLQLDFARCHTLDHQCHIMAAPGLHKDAAWDWLYVLHAIQAHVMQRKPANRPG